MRKHMEMVMMMMIKEEEKGEEREGRKGGREGNYQVFAPFQALFQMSCV